MSNLLANQCVKEVYHAKKLGIDRIVQVVLDKLLLNIFKIGLGSCLPGEIRSYIFDTINQHIVIRALMRSEELGCIFDGKGELAGHRLNC